MWSTVSIYTLPQVAVIDFLKDIPAMTMCVVNTLTEDTLTSSDLPTEDDFRWNYRPRSMPDGGILSVQTDVDDFFDRHTNFDEAKMYAILANDYGVIGRIPGILGDWTLSDDHLKLLISLRRLNEQTRVPVMYYDCATTGGPEQEFSVVFDDDIFVYWEDRSDRTKHGLELKNNVAFKLQTSVLQKGLEHLGVILPGKYFALHSRSADAMRYYTTRMIS